ncbi:DUF4225 domain-containing protein [Erwinia mallotivora]|uniref:DUF4225 domain-containing protein n=1 Tax=Erwinia mallotivora TaxID=69222 RepID=UPI0021C0BAD6|nr:DUF4225 domain-containing protein [Erwinia mallotivora]
MAINAYSHLRYDLDNYIVELQRVSELAATFLIKDALNRHDYLREISADIRDYQSRFDNEKNPHNQTGIIEELKAELKLTEREYQMLRMKDHVTYIVTDVFEEHGVLKYAKVAGGIFGGSMEAWGGFQLAKLGHSLKIKRLKGVGIILALYGANNVYESVTPVLYEHSESGPIRYLYRKAAELAGFSNDEGDLAYSSVELSLSLYAAVRTPVLTQNPGRLVSKYLGEQPGTGKLFRHVNNDFITKWASKNGIMKLYFGLDSARKIKAKFYDEEYKYDEKFSLKE